MATGMSDKAAGTGLAIMARSDRTLKRSRITFTVDSKYASFLYLVVSSSAMRLESTPENVSIRRKRPFKKCEASSL